MAREIDPTKPLSKADREYLLARYPLSYVNTFPGAGVAEPERVGDLPEIPLQASVVDDEDLLGLAFDPSEHTVDEVQEYLDGVDEGERERILAAERDGKARRSLLG